MIKNQEIDYDSERSADVSAVLNSEQHKKVVVAGPGTGKSFLFEQVINKKRAEGKTNFLAITFIGKLGDALADDLAGLAETHTLHGFARQFFLSHCSDDWEYYPYMDELIKNDLSAVGITEFKIGDENYKERTVHYKAVGHADVVHYAVQICKKDAEKIPKFDLILIDEFQDFNEIEAEFIDLLATKNEMLIVGDDDQALYEFKGSSPKYIRDKFGHENVEFESHTLRFCSRCTEPIINAFHNIVDGFKLSAEGNERIKKDYICYLPGKARDGEMNPKLGLMENVNPGNIPYKIREQLEHILETQKIKSVLIIGEGQSCQPLLHAIAKKFRAFGFTNIDHTRSELKPFDLEQTAIDGYKFLAKGKNLTLAWRLVAQISPDVDVKKILTTHYSDSKGFINSLTEEYKSQHASNAKVLHKLLHEPPSKVKAVADSSIAKLQEVIVKEKTSDRDLLTSQLVSENSNLPRPLSNLDITICSILGSKGLGADVVFLVGFDQGKLPLKKTVQESEIYQMLVALTRAKKRIYLINTLNSQVSQFANHIDSKIIQRI